VRRELREESSVGVAQGAIDLVHDQLRTPRPEQNPIPPIPGGGVSILKETESPEDRFLVWSSGAEASPGVDNFVSSQTWAHF